LRAYLQQTLPSVRISWIEKERITSARVRVSKGVIVRTAHAVTDAGLSVMKASLVHHALLSLVPLVLMLDVVNFALSFAALVWKSNVIPELIALTENLAQCPVLPLVHGIRVQSVAIKCFLAAVDVPRLAARSVPTQSIASSMPATISRLCRLTC
jgi:hypothetical protein